MALNKEIWIADIVEGFFPANDFVTKSIDHSAYVNNKTVHVPNGGLPPEIKVNPASFPIAAVKRTDSDLTYNIDTFCSVPIHIQNAEVAELSYNKRQSVIGQMRQELQRVVSEAILSNWVPSSPVTLATSGAAVAAHISAATGNRKAFAINDVKKLKLMFDKEDLPSTGRYILLDANMYNDLMGEMTDGVKMNFLSGADPTSGIVGRFMGFDFMMRSKVLKTNQSGALKAWSTTGAATDCAAGLAWHKDSVARALGSVTMFTNDQDPQYYGDIMSCEVRAGGACCRSDKKGVVLIYEGTAA